jgi:hypothetical protein
VESIARAFNARQALSHELVVSFLATDCTHSMPGSLRGRVLLYAGAFDRLGSSDSGDRNGEISSSWEGFFALHLEAVERAAISIVTNYAMVWDHAIDPRIERTARCVGVRGWL